MASETRKVQITGGSTYIVSLPPQWVKQNGITKGSILSLEASGDSLNIYMNERKRKEIIRELDVSGTFTDDLLPRTLVSLYISGFDTLVVKSQTYISQDIKSVVKKFSRLVMGVEIFEESSTAITLQNVLDSESFPLSTALKRMIMNVQMMLIDTMRGMEIMEKELLENIIGRDDDVDRYHFYIMKEISMGRHEGTDTVFNLIFSRILERVADHAVNICNLLKDCEKMDQRKRGELITFMKECNDVFQEATTAFMGADLKTLNKIVNVKESIMSRKESMMARKYGDVNFSGILEDISRIGMYSTDISEITMDRYVQRNEKLKI
jgi:Phosphate uptake regulator